MGKIPESQGLKFRIQRLLNTHFIMHIIFDYDGTLADSSQGILQCLKYTLSKFSILPIRELGPSIIGPPLRETLRNLCPASDDSLIDLLVDTFKDNYDSHGFMLSQPFPGINSMLAELHDSGYILHIATNKRSLPTMRSLEYLNWRHFFTEIVSVDSISPAFNSKASMLAHILDKCKAPNFTFGYIGDRLDDYRAARAVNISYLMVRWGFDETTQAKSMSSGFTYLEKPCASEVIDYFFPEQQQAQY